MDDSVTHSAEMRWFLPGRDQLGSFRTWFRHDNRLPVFKEASGGLSEIRAPYIKEEPTRSDEYLGLPAGITMSVKQRQGKLEVKAMEAHPRFFIWGENEGRIERWAKWSFSPSQIIAGQLQAELGRSAAWRVVVKERWLQKYSLVQGSIAAIPPDVQPQNGCLIELTCIQVEAGIDAWLTFAFEAFGPPRNSRSILEKAARHFFGLHGPAPVRLTRMDSKNYPAWLAKLR